MLFLVPDTDAADGASAQAPSGKQASGLKVELDLADAPFLEEEPAAAEAPAPRDESPPPILEKPRSGMKERILAQKKKLFIAGGTGILLLVAATALNVFFSGEETPPAPTPVEPRRVTVPSERPPETPAKPAPAVVSFDPFLVERRGAEGEIRFLRIRFAIPVAEDAPELSANLWGKRVAIRDAVYYYLSNKPLTFLQEQKTQEEIKTDLISVINEHISPAKVTELYLEDYLVITP